MVDTNFGRILETARGRVQELGYNGCIEILRSELSTSKKVRILLDQIKEFRLSDIIDVHRMGSDIYFLLKEMVYEGTEFGSLYIMRINANTEDELYKRILYMADLMSHGEILLELDIHYSPTNNIKLLGYEGTNGTYRFNTDYELDMGTDIDTEFSTELYISSLLGTVFEGFNCISSSTLHRSMKLFSTVYRQGVDIDYMDISTEQYIQDIILSAFEILLLGKV